MEFSVITQPLGSNVPTGDAASIELLGLPFPLSVFFTGQLAPTVFDLPDGQVLNIELRASFPGSTEPVSVKASAQAQAVKSLSISQPSPDLVLANFEHRALTQAEPANAPGQCTVTCSKTNESRSGRNVCIECSGSKGTVKICC